jgi:hypothetical protein
MRHIVALIALLCPLAAPFVSDSAACTCAGQSPCQLFNGAGAVFVGDVIEVKRAGTQVVARMHVRHVLKGQVGQVVSVRSGSGSSSCDVHFEIGHRRLVFAGGSVDDFSVSVCSGGGVLAPDAPLPTLPVPGRLSGLVADVPIARIARSRVDGSNPAVPVTSGRIWFDTPSGRRETAIDSSGRFQFDNVDPGEGMLHADVGPAYEARPTHFAIRDVTDCDVVFVSARPAGRLAGSVVGPDGRGVAGIQLELRPHVEPDVSYPLGTQTETDPSGRFEFRGLTAGEYVLGVNVGVLPSVGNPYAALYYPGVPDRAGATVLSVGGGGGPELDAPFVLPQALPTRALTVSVKCRDGSIPPILSVDAVASDRSSRAEHEFSRDRATATMTLLRDVAYDLEIKASFPRPDHDTFLTSRVVERRHVEAGEATTPINVVAPFVACDRRERLTPR